MPIVLPRNAAKIVKLSSKLAAAEVAVVEAHEAKAAMDAAERSHKAEVREAKAKALADYQNSEEFTALLDKEVMGQCDDLVYRFKRYNADMKLTDADSSDDTDSSSEKDEAVPTPLAVDASTADADDPPAQ
ncbi:unnamed protein product [Prunus armeniaca]